MTASSTTGSEADKLLQAIQALEAQRPVLGDAVVEAALAPLREKLASLQSSPLGEQRKLVSVLFADLTGFTEHGIEGFEGPVEIFLACYRVLHASQDPRASGVLHQGHDLLQSIAVRIDDDSQRRAYLERAPENRALLEA